MRKTLLQGNLKISGIQLNGWGGLKAVIFISTRGFEEEASVIANKITAADTGVKSVLEKLVDRRSTGCFVSPKGSITIE